MTSTVSGETPWRYWLWLVAWLALCLAVGFVGSHATLPKIATWYAGLTKPSFNPPNWIFGPVWTTLYIMMAISAWRISVSRIDAAAKKPALFAFLGQLGLNALWSPVFFGLESPSLALFIIIALLSALALTVVVFFRIDRLAGWLLIPYLAWVGFATLLNASIVALN